MSYIGSAAGVIPVSFSGVNSQSFNGDGSTVAFTLNRPVATVKDVEVVVNNVQQSPYDGSYSVTGSTLTFSAAPSTGTANVYVTFRDQPVGTLTDTTAVSKSGDTMTGNLIVNASVGIGTSSPATPLDVTKANGGNFVATFQNTSSSTPYGVFIKDAPSGANGYPLLTVTNSAGAHYFRVDSGTGYVTMPYQPCFNALNGGAQSGAVVVVFDSTNLNVGAGYSTSTNRFTAPVAGNYFFSSFALKDNNNTDTVLVLAKNGTYVTGYSDTTGSNYTSLSVSGVVSLAAGDYVEVRTTSGGIYSNYRNFSGFLIG